MFLFKISASLLKPTRESLLDYCSYCLIVISLVGVARVWIGGASLRNGCPLIDETMILTLTETTKHQLLEEGSGNEPPPIKDHKEVPSGKNSSEFSLPEKLIINDDIDNNSTNQNPGELHNNSTLNKLQISEICAKYYQAVFAYILLIESSILLFSGLIWTEVPKITHTLKRFTKLIHKCEASDWAKKALNVITDRRQTGDVSQSLYSVISTECTNYNIRSLLDTLFHPDGDYRAKAKARHLYEEVQTFCDGQSDETNIWTTYIFKSMLQFGFWIVIFNINLVLFVVMEFYVICPEDTTLPCEHDTFLRIVWFMGQTVLLVFAVFNCKTLRWINEKSIVRRRPCCNSLNCFQSHKTFYTADDSPMLTCLPYRFSNNSPVFNDIALLLHLLEESRPRVLPYFVVFMFPEWKEKLTSFANPVHMSERPIRSAMQMLSGGPPPVIEITDIPNLPEMNLLQTKNKRKHKNAVTFYIDSENDDVALPETSLKDEPINSSNMRTYRSNSPGGYNALINSDKDVLHLPKLSQHPQCHNKHTYRNQKEDIIELNVMCDVSKTKSKGTKPKYDGSDSVSYGAEGNDADETTVLVHKTSSSESVRSSGSNSQSATESIKSSDNSERNLLLK